MLEPHGSPMKWPGTGVEEEAGEAGLQGARASQVRTQDDAAVHYVFQRDPQEELPSLAPKQRWAVGEDAITENQDKWKNPIPINMNNMHQQGPGIQLKNSQTNQQQFINHSIASSVGTLAINSSVIGSHPAHLTTNMVHTQLAPLQNHALGNNLTIQNSAMMLPPLQGMQNAPQLGQQGLCDFHQHHGNPMQAMNGIGKSAEHLMYLSQAGMLAPGTNQFLQQGQNQLGLTPVAAIRNQVVMEASARGLKVGSESCTHNWTRDLGASSGEVTGTWKLVEGVSSVFFLVQFMKGGSHAPGHRRNSNKWIWRLYRSWFDNNAARVVEYYIHHF